MKAVNRLALSAALALGAAVAADAAAYTVSLTGNIADFSGSVSYSGSSQYIDYSLPLSGLDATDAITVAMGDTIEATTTLNTPYTIAASNNSTLFLQYFCGSSFPSENTGVTGTFRFYDGTTLVKTLGYYSTTSNQLASFGVLFPPTNTAFTFDSIVNDVAITTLPTPATLDGSSLRYILVNSVPDAPTWSLLIAGFAAVGVAARRRPAAAAAAR